MLLRKWRAGSFLRLRSGLIFAHSLGKNFKASAWFRGVFHVSPFQQQVEEQPMLMADTSSLQSSTESSVADLPLFSWKMLRESSAQNSQAKVGTIQRALRFCSMSSESWKEWVTGRRQAYLAQAKSARLTSANEFLSWPTATSQDGKQGGITPSQEIEGAGHTGLLHIAAIKEERNWPTVRSTDSNSPSMQRIKVGPNGGKGYQLREAIAKEGNWPTPEASIMEIWGEEDRIYWTGHLPRRVVRSGISASLGLARLVQVPGFGLAAQDTPNSGGNRREWLTPKTGDTQPTIHHPERKDGGQPNLAWQMEKQWATPCSRDHHPNGQAAGSKTDLGNQVAQWGTPAANDAKKQKVMCEVNSKQAGLAKSVGLELQKQWATPRASKTTEENQETWQARQEKGDVQTMPLTLQVKVDWRTPQAQEAGAKVETLFTKDGKPARPGERAYRRTPSGELVLQSQTINQQVEMVERKWGTPRVSMAQDKQEDSGKHKLGEQVQHLTNGRLSPRWVESLMGLPLGWSAPSCPASVTRNWLKFINGWL
jgi:hypothetical protein